MGGGFIGRPDFIAVCVNAQVLIVRLIEKFVGGCGRQGHRASDRRHRVSMIIFLRRFRLKKETELTSRKNLKAADKSQIKYSNNGCDVSKGICL